MAGLEFAIIQYVEKGKARILRRWDEEKLRLELYRAVMIDKLSIDEALDSVIQEFKDETIRIV